MTLSEFRQIAKEEFFYTLNAYFMPVTFVWVLLTKGWPSAKAHFSRYWNEDSPLIKRSRAARAQKD